VLPIQKGFSAWFSEASSECFRGSNRFRNMLSNHKRTAQCVPTTLRRAMVFGFLVAFGFVFGGNEIAVFVSRVSAQEKKPKPLTNQELNFFESLIRPVLVKACYECHSVSAGSAEGGLLLDSREGMLRGGESGAAIVAGDVKKSLLLKRISSDDANSVMPPKEHAERLSASVVKDFTTWVKLGAPDPRRESKGSERLRKEVGKTAEAAKQWWSYQPLLQNATQENKKGTDQTSEPSTWAWTQIDRFIEAGYERQGIKPVSDATPEVLLRRLHYDLTGLPPSLEELDAFQASYRSGVDRQELIEGVVDRLMQTDSFAVHWARHWLDVARYGESSGRESNVPYNYAWRYRDWVIDAFRCNKPFDEFLVEQIAGDLIEEEDPVKRSANIVATGFLAIGSRNVNEFNQKLFAVDQADEQIDTVFQATMAMTMACARCHDHKFEPITQKQYTAVAGIFLSTETFYGASGGNNARNIMPPIVLPENCGLPVLPMGLSDEQIEAKRSELVELREQVSVINKEIQENRKGVKAGGMLDRSRQQELNKLNIKLNDLEFLLSTITEDNRPKVLAMGVADKPIAQRFDVGGKTKKPKRPEANPRRTFYSSIADSPLFSRGDVEMPGEVVERAVPNLLGSTVKFRIPEDTSGRLQLARWITSQGNPVTSRVAVNRLWAWTIGRGIVDTVDNFGTTGSEPSHPELLDYLAGDFMESGWDVRSTLRKILTSRTYQLSSIESNPEALVRDPEIAFCWRAKSRRLMGEEIRDSMLKISDRLDETPVLATALARSPDRNRVDSSIGKKRKKGEVIPEDFCRSIYLPLPRDAFPDVLELFDMPDATMVQGIRDSTNVPSQSLYLLNNQTVASYANTIVQNAIETFPGRGSDTFEQRVTWLYRKILSRTPSGDELRLADQLLKQSESSESGWVSLVRGLLATAEFRYLD